MKHAEKHRAAIVESMNNVGSGIKDHHFDHHLTHPLICGLDT